MPFAEQVWQFLGLSVAHAAVMFPYLTLPPLLISPVLQAVGRDPARARLLENPGGSWWRAVWLGICSPPSRSRVFREAQGLLAAGVSPANVLVYLVAAHSLIVYVPLLLVALSGPQPVIGLGLAALACMQMVRCALRGIGAVERENAKALPLGWRSPEASSPNPGWVRRAARNLSGDIGSLWWPLLLGATLGAVVAVWGLSDAFFSIHVDNGVGSQVVSALVGLLLAYVAGVPPVGNLYLGAWLWKTEFFGYAGLMAFYLGVLVTPFALPRYTELSGRELGWKIVQRLVVSILAAALIVTAFWYALDWLLHAVGLGAPIEALMDSRIKPTPIPWFHTLFWTHAH